MLTTAMTTQISTTRTTWAVLIEVAGGIHDAEWAHIDCRLRCGAGAGQGMQRHRCGADTEPNRAQAHGDVGPGSPGGLDAALRQPSVYLLVDLPADPFDQPLGQGIVVPVTEFAMRGCCRRNVLMCTYVHKSKVCCDRLAGQQG